MNPWNWFKENILGEKPKTVEPVAVAAAPAVPVAPPESPMDIVNRATASMSPDERLVAIRTILGNDQDLAAHTYVGLAGSDLITDEMLIIGAITGAQTRAQEQGNADVPKTLAAVSASMFREQDGHYASDQGVLNGSPDIHIAVPPVYVSDVPRIALSAMAVPTCHDKDGEVYVLLGQRTDNGREQNLTPAGGLMQSMATDVAEALAGTITPPKHDTDIDAAKDHLARNFTIEGKDIAALNGTLLDAQTHYGDPSKDGTATQFAKGHNTQHYIELPLGLVDAPPAVTLPEGSKFEKAMWVKASTLEKVADPRGLEGEVWRDPASGLVLPKVYETEIDKAVSRIQDEILMSQHPFMPLESHARINGYTAETHLGAQAHRFFQAARELSAKIRETGDEQAVETHVAAQQTEKQQEAEAPAL